MTFLKSFFKVSNCDIDDYNIYFDIKLHVLFVNHIPEYIQK